MGVKELDNRVLNFIELLQSNNEEISIRRIAKGLGKEKSLRSIQLSLERLKKAGDIFKTPEGRVEFIKKDSVNRVKTRSVPLVGDISCGGPILANEYIEDYISISEDLLKTRSDYFLLRTSGDSMNKKGINPGDVILIKKQNTANNGDIVVALIDDTVTLKEFKIDKGIIKLFPHSTNPENKIMLITEDLIIQGIYIMNLGKI